ncbi:MAG: aminoacetone oxidase family FAD-binding enzyme [Firmicutes bacterium]|nr:aminoacetone oxidase family FAD-binding enzyme [Bacillota bacterium]
MNNDVFSSNEFCGSASVIVIGAGASGLIAAASAAHLGTEVIVIEGNDKVGKKLLATGNGRCNFTNKQCSVQSFNDSGDGFVKSVLNKFSAADAIKFFENIGVLAREEDEGRCYPYSGQASSLVSALRRRAELLGVRFLLDDGAEKVGFSEQKNNINENKFYVRCRSGRLFTCKSIVIACGGRAGLKFGSTGDGYGFSKTFGHTLAAPRPGLVAVESNEDFMPALKGVRAKARVMLMKQGVAVAEESGEVQFTGTGISGICIFDLSRFMNAPRPPAKKKKHKSIIEIKDNESYEYNIRADFVPEKSEEEIYNLLIKFISCGRDGAVTLEAKDRHRLEEIISGIVNVKLAAVISNLAFQNNKNDAVRQAARFIKNFNIKVSHTKGWEDAQVTCGGIRREEIDPETMESKIQSGLYFCGEVVDVDGKCGGYNLQWAWASGVVCGRAVSR